MIGLKVNFYARVVDSDKKASNGYIHVLDHPLLPPASILDELFLASDHMSTLTSSIQKVHGEHYLQWHFSHMGGKHKPVFQGTALATMFAPTNEAFKALDERLKFFLFSPFGARALEMILSYHYVPETLLLSEVLYTKHDKSHKHEHRHKHGRKQDEDEMSTEGWFDFGADDPSFHKEIEVPTALGKDHPLKVVIDKSKFLPVEGAFASLQVTETGAVKISMKVNDMDISLIDVPALNGAFHVSDRADDLSADRR